MTQLLVALDGLSVLETLEAAELVMPCCDGIKLGDILLEEGGHLIRHMKNKGYFIMVDNKWWDKPRTVGNKIRRESDNGADLVTVSLHCDEKALTEARQAATHAKLIGVTILTSTDPGPSDRHMNILVQEFIKLSKKAIESGLDGITVPGPLLHLMTKLPGELFALTPAVRMPGDDVYDQILVASEPPRLAKYAVVGEPIVKNEFPSEAAKRYREWLRG